MLYLLFFLLRDGDELFGTIKNAIPLRAEQQRAVFSKFATVIRATVKGKEPLTVEVRIRDREDIGEGVCGLLSMLSM